jgi:signal transduction histidine kinase
VRAKDIKLEFAEDCSFLARIHEVLFGQLLNNLLDNACKYSPEGSSIVIRVERVGLNCCCSVRDSGIGIDAEDLKHVFEPFFRSSQSRERGISGAGLGLAIARRIARRFGGDVLVESTIQEGSVFTIRLPLVEDGSQENSDATSRLISSV